MPDERRQRGGYASSPCSLHEFRDPARAEPTPAADVQAWRRAERERLLALRLAIPAAERRAFDAAIASGLDGLLPGRAAQCIAVYWPIRGEPDLQAWCRAVAAAGGRLALPEIAVRAAPLVFRAWRPGQRMRKGVFNIPVPAEGDLVQPDVVITPLVGYDGERHRLGNGGGYYDRTLASMTDRPTLIGVGYERTALRTIYPQPFDIAMNYIVTESSVIPAG